MLLVFMGLGCNGMAQNDSISFLSLGDSYTEATSELAINSWPYQLSLQLRKKKVAIKDPLIIAKVGWTTTDLLQAIEEKNPKPVYDLVSLLIGVNNQYQGKDFELFEREFPELLQKSIVFAKNDPKRVMVLSIPDWTVTPFARFKDKKRIIKELQAYNKFIEQETKNRGATFIDITKISRNASLRPDWITHDSLHPSKKMYKAWVRKVQKDFKFQSP
ncbi:SGNH/GDSL hydrolase family protein [Flagellimonas myxillae]|uniref:SGNH/GDSL hydrolase family protein n=1 Tax=Flagellimonas myxillae TaxID=2942214 RepID=UPI00201F6D00|nr:GDSL-type esterase/lipase family protein [Muricauda myxillae]MCL6267854.1 GDSL-type esterase/lipase family protein [Muricauda myxillae]